MKTEDYNKCMDLINDKIKSLGLNENNIYRTSMNLSKLFFSKNFENKKETNDNSCYNSIIKVYDNNNKVIFSFMTKEIFNKNEKMYICTLDTCNLMSISNIDYEALQYFLNRIQKV